MFYVVVALVCMLIALLLLIVYSCIYKPLIGLSVHLTVAVALHDQYATVCAVDWYLR